MTLVFLATLVFLMTLPGVSYVPCVPYDPDWLAVWLVGWLAGLCCIRKQDLSSADTSLYFKMIRLISIIGGLASWLASWLGWLAGWRGLAGWLADSGCLWPSAV